MKKKKLTFELDNNPNSKDEFIAFLNSLAAKDIAKLMAVIKKTEKFGFETAIHMKWATEIEENLFELKPKVDHNIQRGIYVQTIDSRYVIKTPK